MEKARFLSSTNDYDIIEAEILGSNLTFIKIYSIGDGSCFYHSLGEMILKKYQDSTTREKKEMIRKFRKEISEFLIEESSLTKKEVTDNIKELIGINGIKLEGDDITKCRIKLSKSTDIYAVSQKFVEEKKIKGNCNFFALFPHITTMGLLQRYEEYKSNSTTSMIESSKIQDIIDYFKTDKDATFIHVFIVSKILGINLCICKMSTIGVYIENFEIIDVNFPTIIIFHIGNIHYESGGIVTEQGIQTIFYPPEDAFIINLLSKYKTSIQNVDLQRSLSRPQQEKPIENVFDSINLDDI
jgi:hypothetical protein